MRPGDSYVRKLTLPQLDTTVAVFRWVAVRLLNVMGCYPGVATLRHLLSVVAGYPVPFAASSRVL